MEYVECPGPGCAQSAEVRDRWELDSTDGPIPHIRVRCLTGHTFALPTEMLARAREHDHRGVSSDLARMARMTIARTRRR